MKEPDLSRNEYKSGWQKIQQINESDIGMQVINSSNKLKEDIKRIEEQMKVLASKDEDHIIERLDGLDKDIQGIKQFAEHQTDECSEIKKQISEMKEELANIKHILNDYKFFLEKEIPLIEEGIQIIKQNIKNCDNQIGFFKGIFKKNTV